MSDAERYEQALRVLINNLVRDTRPMAYELALSLAQFAQDVLDGMTPGEAAASQLGSRP